MREMTGVNSRFDVAGRHSIRSRELPVWVDFTRWPSPRRMAAPWGLKHSTWPNDVRRLQSNPIGQGASITLLPASACVRRIG